MSVFAHTPRPANAKSITTQSGMVLHVCADNVLELERYMAVSGMPYWKIRSGMKRFPSETDLAKTPCASAREFERLHGCVHVEVSGEWVQRIWRDLSVEKLTTSQYLERLKRTDHVSDLPVRRLNQVIQLNQPPAAQQIPLLEMPAVQVHRDE